MAIGERINFFRKKNNLTMNYLGQLLGFPAKGADVRIIQYVKTHANPRPTSRQRWRKSSA